MATPKRRYSSGLRDDQTRLTRRRVLEAAHRQFVIGGYTATTVEAIARDAGVSLQTIYNTVGNKAALLSAAYDVAIAGDDDAIPIARRPVYQAALSAGDGPTCLARYAALSRQLAERAAPLAAVILAEAGNPDIQALADATERQRAHGAAAIADHVAGRFHLRPELTAAEAADVVWTLTAPETAIRLVQRRHWSWDRYQDWLADTLAHTILGQPNRSSPRRTVKQPPTR